LGINRKNVYRQSKQEEKDQVLKLQIEVAWEEHPCYGHLRLGWHLKVNHKRVSRVMRRFGMKVPRRRRSNYYCTTSVPHKLYENLIIGIKPTRPNQIWCADVSFIKFEGRFWYISTIEDIATRQILAIQVSRYHNHQLILSTLKQAIFNAKGLPEIFHSDQGTEYMAQAVTTYLESYEVKVSASAKASPWENGYQESFFGRFKDEMGDMDRFETVGEFVEAIYQQVSYYNTKRIHKALKMPPAVYALTFS